jgi:hypothetical protein
METKDVIRARKIGERLKHLSPKEVEFRKIRVQGQSKAKIW